MMDQKNGWVLIQSDDDWEMYQQGVATQLGKPVSKLNWGPPPAVTPCLVASVSPDGLSILSSYVFPADARRLLTAFNEGVHTQPDADRPATPDDDVVSGVQAEHNKAMAAHVLTLVQLMVDTGIVKSKEDYEKRFSAMLAHVDQEAQSALLDHVANKDRPS